MSRKQIEPLLNELFSEKGIVQWILSFDDFAHDLLRLVWNVAPVSYSETALCVSCKEYGCHRAFLTILGSKYMITLCPKWHMELSGYVAAHMMLISWQRLQKDTLVYEPSEFDTGWQLIRDSQKSSMLESIILKHVIII